MTKTFEAVAIAAGLSSVLFAPGARAMSPEVGNDCEFCQYPTVVRMPLCTGIYMGQGLIVTAAHCIDNVHEGVSKARFGEADGSWHYESVIHHCVAHPDGEPDTTALGDPTYKGPDIAYCILEDTLAALADTPGNPPIIPPMIPKGCERNWLAHQVYETADHAIVTALGAGCSFHQEYVGQDCQDDVKRYAAEQLIEQLSYNGSSTKLRLRRDLWGGESGVHSGDSGGPVLLKLPDNTWRLIGVLHGTSLDNAYAEAVPPYIHWIEQSSGIDITPFHEFNGSSWYAVSGAPLLPKYEHDANWGYWSSACSGAPKGSSPSYNGPHVLGGYECAGWDLPPDELKLETKNENSTHVSREGTSSLKLQTNDRTQQQPDDLVYSPLPMTAPLPFLHVERTFTRSGENELQPLWQAR